MKTSGWLFVGCLVVSLFTTPVGWAQESPSEERQESQQTIEIDTTDPLQNEPEESEAPSEIIIEVPERQSLELDKLFEIPVFTLESDAEQTSSKPELEFIKIPEPIPFIDVTDPLAQSTTQKTDEEPAEEPEEASQQVPVIALDPIEIAHRGAPGYLPEHTLEGVAFAHAEGADFIEQDVVLSRDGVPVVLHDLRLDNISDVAKKFPERTRSDGYYYVADFSVAELKQLTLTERVIYHKPEGESEPETEDQSANESDADAEDLDESQNSAEQAPKPLMQLPTAEESARVNAALNLTASADGDAKKVKQDKRYIANKGKTRESAYPTRFPVDTGNFKIATLAEHLTLIKGLNRSRQTNTGIYIELKSSTWHRQQGYDLMGAVMGELSRQGFADGQMPMPLYLQSFNPEDLRRWAREYPSDAQLVQLIGENSWNESSADYSAMRTSAGLESIANQAHAIGVWLPHILEGVDDQGRPQFTSLVKNAHKAGLKVHVYTLRADDLPEGVEDYQTLIEWLRQARVDGYFTDFPGLAEPVVKASKPIPVNGQSLEDQGSEGKSSAE